MRRQSSPDFLSLRGLSRRHCLRLGAALCATALGTSACHKTPQSLLRIGAHPWLGYELMALAREMGFLRSDQLRLVDMPTANASLRALAAGTLEGAGLTLDEVLSARARGLMLRVVAVVDVSHGADVLLGAPGLDKLADIRGRKVGVEQSATGALMLDAALARAGLSPDDVKLVNVPFDEHAQALRSGSVDAVVTFDPVRSQLLADGAKTLFSSAEVPGLIVDVLAVRPEAAQQHPEQLRMLVSGLLAARAAFLQDGAMAAELIAPRLGIPPEAVSRAFELLHLPDLPTNRRMLEGQMPELETTAQRLLSVMKGAALLPAAAKPLAGTGPHDALTAPQFLPKA